MIFPRYEFKDTDTPLTQIYKVKEECSEAILEGVDDSYSDKFLEECMDIIAASEGLERMSIEKFGVDRFSRAKNEVYWKNVRRGYWKEYGSG